MEHSYEQIKKYLIAKSRQAIPYKQVIEAYCKEYEIKEPGPIINLFEQAKKDYPNFEQIQYIIKTEFAMDYNSGQYYLVDQVKAKITEINLLALKTMFSGKAFSTIEEERLHTCVMGYNPNSKNLFFKEENAEFKSINAYRPASWQIPYFYYGHPIPKNDIPEIYKKYFNHLTGGSNSSTHYLINFMASTVQTNKKAFTYCTMLGGMGIGKGVLADILSKLIGEKNYSNIPANKLSDNKFNAPAKNKKLIFLDELEIRNQSDENALKHFVNPTISIEEKGKDQKTYANYANILIASNNLSKLKIEPGDRRYSMIDMGKESLIKFANREYNIPVGEYVNKLLDDDNIKDLGTYLLNYEIDMKSITEVLQSEARKNQDLHGLAEWELCLFREVAPKYAGKEIPLSEAKNILREMSDNSKVNPGRESWKKLEEKFPGFFKRIKKVFPDGRQVYHIKFEELDKQPKFLVSEKED